MAFVMSFTCPRGPFSAGVLRLAALQSEWAAKTRLMVTRGVLGGQDIVQCQWKFKGQSLAFSVLPELRDRAGMELVQGKGSGCAARPLATGTCCLQDPGVSFLHRASRPDHTQPVSAQTVAASPLPTQHHCAHLSFSWINVLCGNFPPTGHLLLHEKPVQAAMVSSTDFLGFFTVCVGVVDMWWTVVPSSLQSPLGRLGNRVLPLRGRSCSSYPSWPF